MTGVIVLIIVAFIAISIFQVVKTVSRARSAIERVSETAAQLSNAGSSGAVGNEAGSIRDSGALASLPGRLDRSAAGDLDAVIQFHYLDHSPADWHLDISGGACQLATGQAAAPQVTISAPWETISDIVEGRLSGDAAFMAGKVQVGGDNSLLFRLNQLFPPGQPGASGRSSDAFGMPAVASAAPTANGQGSVAHRSELGTTLSNFVLAAVTTALGEVLGPALEESGHLSRPESEQVIAAAISGRFGDESLLVPGATEASSLIHRDHQHHRSSTGQETLRAAVREAMEALPPNATLQDRAKALRAAIQNLNGQPVDVEV